MPRPIRVAALLGRGGRSDAGASVSARAALSPGGADVAQRCARQPGRRHARIRASKIASCAATVRSSDSAAPGSVEAGSPAGVLMNAPHDRAADLVAGGPHHASMKLLVEASKLGVVDDRLRHPLALFCRVRRALVASGGTRPHGPSPASSSRRTVMRLSSNVRVRDRAGARCVSTVGSRRFHSSRRCTVVPRPCSTRTRPRSSSEFEPFTQHRPAEAELGSHSTASVGSTAPSGRLPPMIRGRQLLDDHGGEPRWTCRTGSCCGNNVPGHRWGESIHVRTSYVSQHGPRFAW